MVIWGALVSLVASLAWPFRAIGLAEARATTAITSRPDPAAQNLCGRSGDGAGWRKPGESESADMLSHGNDNRSRSPLQLPGMPGELRRCRQRVLAPAASWRPLRRPRQSSAERSGSSLLALPYHWEAEDRSVPHVPVRGLRPTAHGQRRSVLADRSPPRAGPASNRVATASSVCGPAVSRRSGHLVQ